MSEHEPTELERLWERQDLVFGPLDVSSEAFVAEIAAAYRNDERRLWWLNVQEVLPAVAIAVFFANRMRSAAQPWAVGVGVALVLGVAAALIAMTIRERRSTSVWGTSVRDGIARRLDQVRLRSRLYRSVVWWYLLPLMVAIVLVRFGMDGQLRLGRGDIIYYAVMVLGAALLRRANRWYGRRYEVEVERLSAVLADFDRSD